MVDYDFKNVMLEFVHTVAPLYAKLPIQQFVHSSGSFISKKCFTQIYIFQSIIRQNFNISSSVVFDTHLFFFFLTHFNLLK